VWSEDQYSVSAGSEYELLPGFASAEYAGYPLANTGFGPYSGAFGRPDQTPPPYWPKPEPVAPPVDGYAITSLVFGLIGGVLFAIGFGIAALRRIGRGERSGRGLAVAGISLATAWIVVIGVVAALVVANRDDPAGRDASGAIVHKGDISPLDLRVGDCASLPTGLGAVVSVTAVPCAEPHNTQVYTTVTATAAVYPGVDPLETEGLTACRDQLAAFLGTTARRRHGARRARLGSW
jgi:hypothetical protein